MAETIIEIKNLHKYFGKNKVLKGIDLDIKKGEVVVIIGPSGSGKSTFLRSMNLLETPTKGVISFEGVDITDKSNDIFKMREQMGMVFHPASTSFFLLWRYEDIHSSQLTDSNGGCSLADAEGYASGA
ncbi:Polar-amino-acid-transporting ATPase [Streptococcus thermophilus CNCM I-1630]|nr:Polar-amino-acid-transporting ATPase [Streptococcus thermophilus CNCM I-1630]